MVKNSQKCANVIKVWPLRTNIRFIPFFGQWPKTKKSAVLFVYFLYKKSAFCQKMTAEWTRQNLQLGSTRNLKSIMHFSLNLEVNNFKSFYNGVWIIMPKPFVFPSGSAINSSHKARAEILFISAENLILMKEISKKCSTDQTFILKEITPLKVHTLTADFFLSKVGMSKWTLDFATGLINKRIGHKLT